jgi:hypothetical protein
MADMMPVSNGAFEVEVLVDHEGAAGMPELIPNGTFANGTGLRLFRNGPA